MLIIEKMKNVYVHLRNIRENVNYYKTEECVKKELVKWYWKKTGNKLCLENPQTLNEKIQWMKLYDTTDKKAFLTDKLLVRDWIAKEIGEEYLIPMIASWDSTSQMDFSNLPPRFVLKTNHGSGSNIIVNDKNRLNIRECKIKLNRWMETNFAFKSGFELQYGLINPKIICEKHMGENISDYKFFCINGEPQFVWVDIDRYVKHKRRVFLLDWTEAPFYIGTFSKVEGIDNDMLRPLCLDEMVELARKLSSEFAFVRVDFYEIDGKVYFGEMTFTPSSGTEAFSPAEYDMIYGKMMTLPEKKPFPMARLREVFLQRRTH